MNPNIKRLLTTACQAPTPLRKEKFLQNAKPPQIHTFQFLLAQIPFIRKRVLLASVLIFACGILCAKQFGADCIWPVCALLPFLALCIVAESARSAVYGMSELEQSAKFSLKYVTLARLGSIGFLHFILPGVLILFAGTNASFSFLRPGLYLLTPYLLTAVSDSIVIRKFQGKEGFYLCMGISVFVSFAHILLRELIAGFYADNSLIWWLILFPALAVKTASEYKKLIMETEDTMTWN